MLYDDSIQTIEIDSDENGWLLVLTGDNHTYHFNIHGVGHELLEQAKEKIGPWWEESLDAMKELDAGLDEDADGAYDRRDPKHPHHLRLVVNE